MGGLEVKLPITIGLTAEPVMKYTIVDRPGEHNHVASWRGRCTYCGRVGDNVVEPRRRPWRISWEMVMRYRAMYMGEQLEVLAASSGIGDVD
jgi:hypothetical protein